MTLPPIRFPVLQIWIHVQWHPSSPLSFSAPMSILTKVLYDISVYVYFSAIRLQLLEVGSSTLFTVLFSKPRIQHGRPSSKNCQVEEWINIASKLLASCFPASFSSKVSRIPCQMDFPGHSFHSIILLPMAQWFLWYIISGSNSFAWHSFADPAKCVHIPPV